MNPVAVKELLVAGKLRIERGWCQKSYGQYKMHTDRTSYCASGAIRNARDSGISEMNQDEMDALRVLAVCLKSRSEADIISFNDERGRTKEEVLALYDRAIAVSTAAIVLKDELPYFWTQVWPESSNG